jgi:hypothetical protein
MDCNDFRKAYRECVDAHGYRQCRLELDDIFKCLYHKEMNRYYNVSSPPFSPATGKEIRRNDTTQQKGKL